MTNLRKTTKDLLAIGVLFTFLWSFVWAFTSPENVLGNFLALLVPFILMYAIRRFAMKGYVFLGLTLGVCVVSWFFLSGIWINVAVLAVLVVYLLYSVYAWYYFELEPGFARCVFYHIALVMLFFVVSGGENAEVYQTRIIICFLLIASFAIFYHQMDNLDVKLYMNRNNNHRAAKRVVSVNNRMSLIFVGIVSVAGVIALFLPTGIIFRTISRFFSWLMSLVSVPVPHVPEFDFAVEADEAGEAESIFDLFAEFTARENRVFAAILEALGFLMLIATIIFVLYILARKVKRISMVAKFTDVQEEVELAGSIFDDLRDLIPRFKMFRHPIRRAYEKKVNSHIRQGIMIEDKDTTDVIAKKIKKAEDIDELTAKYVVVRYGGGKK